MEVLNSAISWFEIPVTDFARAQAFYQTIFNTEIQEMQMGPLRMGMFPYDQEGTGIGGALCHGEGYTPAAHAGVKVYLNGGDDLNVVLQRVDAAGGSVVMNKVEIAPGMGHMGFFTDTEGNVVGLHSMG